MKNKVNNSEKTKPNPFACLMDKEAFLKLKPNKKTMEKITAFSIKGRKSKDKDSFEYKYWTFFSGVNASLMDWYKLPKKLRDTLKPPTIKGIYERSVRIKNIGYRKDLQIPFQ